MQVTEEISDKISEIAGAYWEEGQNMKSDFIDALREFCEWLRIDGDSMRGGGV